MALSEQALAVHGFATIEWDHAVIPDKAWAKLSRLPNGCWVGPTAQVATAVQEVMVERILRRNAREAWAITPTCGNTMCANPSHLCVTFKTYLSKEEK